MSDFSADLEKTINRFGKEVQDFVGKIAEEFHEDEIFQPRADIIENDDEFSIFMDLPGSTKSDLNISLKESVLKITGSRKISYAENYVIKKQERSEGAFTRSFALPEDVNQAEIKATFKQGVLKVTLPKSSALKDTTNIEID